MGTLEKQYVIVHMKNGQKYRFAVPRGSYLSPAQLENGIYNGMVEQLQHDLGLTTQINVRKRRAALQQQHGDEGELESPGDVEEEDENRVPTWPQRILKEQAAAKAAAAAAEETERQRQLLLQQEQEERAAALRRAEAERTRQRQQREREEAERRRKAAEQQQQQNARQPAPQSVPTSTPAPPVPAPQQPVRQAAPQQQQPPVREPAPEGGPPPPPPQQQQQQPIRQTAPVIPANLPAGSGLEGGPHQPQLTYRRTNPGDGLAYGEYESIFLVKGKDPHPELRYLHEKDQYIYQRAKARYIARYKLRWDERERMHPDFLDHVETHIKEFKRLYEEEEYNEDYTHRSEQEKWEILRIAKSIQFYFVESIGHFALRINNPQVNHVTLSDQICYVLGFDAGLPIHNGQVAKYMADLHGGVSHLCIYLNSGIMVCWGGF